MVRGVPQELCLQEVVPTGRQGLVRQDVPVGVLELRQDLRQVRGRNAEGEHGRRPARRLDKASYGYCGRRREDGAVEERGAPAGLQ